MIHCPYCNEQSDDPMPIFTYTCEQFVTVCGGCYDAIYKGVQAEIDHARQRAISARIDALMCNGGVLVDTRKGG